jgi:hypothetical protein
MIESNRPSIQWLADSTEPECRAGRAIWTYRSGPAMTETKAVVPFADFDHAYLVDEIVRIAYWSGRRDERHQLSVKLSNAMEGT